MRGIFGSLYNSKRARARAKSNLDFWYAVWDGAGLTYSELMAMSAEEYCEAMAAREMYIRACKDAVK